MNTSWRRIESRDINVRDQLDGVFHTHYRFASKSVRRTWTTWADHVCAREFDLASQLLGEIDREVAVAFEELKAALRRVHPIAATWLLFGERIDRFDMHAYVVPKGGETYSLARGAWIIGVFGSGEHADRRAAYVAFNKYVRWCAAFLAHWNMQSSGNGAPHQPLLGGKIAAHRNLGAETRMRWIAEEVCDALGSWVDVHLDDKKGTFGSQVMHTMSGNSAAALDTLGPLLLARAGELVQLPRLERTVSEQLLLGVPDEIQGVLTAPPQEPSVRALTLALQGEVSDLYPLVRVGERTLVLNRPAWLLERDRLMMNAIMEIVPSDRAGEPLEEVSRTVLQKWGPPDLDWSTGDVIAPRAGGDGDETDLLGVGRDVVLIGECKANRLSKNDRSLDANFGGRILEKAASQVALRIEHWDEGWRPQGHRNHRAKATGLVVTLSSYAGGVWSEPNLHVDGSVIDVAILPLHSLILVAGAISDGASLVEYLNWRTKLLSLGLMSPDELELMLTFGALGPIVPETQDDDARMTFRPYELSENAALELDPRLFLNDDEWRDRYFAQIWDSTTPASNPW